MQNHQPLHVSVAFNGACRRKSAILKSRKMTFLYDRNLKTRVPKNQLVGDQRTAASQMTRNFFNTQKYIKRNHENRDDDYRRPEKNDVNHPSYYGSIKCRAKILYEYFHLAFKWYGSVKL